MFYFLNLGFEPQFSGNNFACKLNSLKMSYFCNITTVLTRGVSLYSVNIETIGRRFMGRIFYKYKYLHGSYFQICSAHFFLTPAYVLPSSIILPLLRV